MTRKGTATAPPSQIRSAGPAQRNQAPHPLPFDLHSYASSIASSAAERRSRTSRLQERLLQHTSPPPSPLPPLPLSLYSGNDAVAVINLPRREHVEGTATAVNPCSADPDAPNALSLLEQLAYVTNASGDEDSSVADVAQRSRASSLGAKSLTVPRASSTRCRSPLPSPTANPQQDTATEELQLTIQHNLSSSRSTLDRILRLRDASPLRQTSVAALEASASFHYHVMTAAAPHRLARELNFSLYQ